jgi:hypothetical protein
MDISRAVSEFVNSGRILFRQLRSEGQRLSKIDLHLLLTQLFILQIEARSLKSALEGPDKHVPTHDNNLHEKEEDEEPDLSPSITAMAASLQVGHRIRAIRNHFPASTGAIGRIRCFKGMPGNWYVIVDWEKPSGNFSDEKTTKFWPISLKHFEVVPEGYNSDACEVLRTYTDG